MSAPAVKPILVIEQEHSLRGLGLLGERLEASGLPYRSLRAWDERIEDVDVDDIGALIPMGGHAHAYDEEAVPLLRSERLLLETAAERAVPVLGICLGAPVLTRALGGGGTGGSEPRG